MTKIFKTAVFGLFLSLSFFFNLNNVSAQVDDLPEINFFFSETCPHCADQKEFHKDLLEKYPDLVINSYNMADSETANILDEFAEQYDLPRNFKGVVPLTFIGQSYIVGFNTPEKIGRSIELALVKNSPGLLAQAEFCDDEESVLCEVDLSGDLFAESVESQNYTVLNQASNLSLFNLNAEKLPLPILSIVLGFLDGFNVCSLGALMLILSLVLTFKDRRKVFLFGGLFLVITGITYAALIFIWFSLFSFLSPFVSFLEILIGLFGLAGGYIFFRQYLRFKKYGPNCEISNSKWFNEAVKKIQAIFKEQKNIWITTLAVILFSFIVTIIEFPCSAVIPVAFAAILADFGVGVAGQAFYLILFMVFYLLDEIIVFMIGVFTLRLWSGGQNMTVKATLLQAIVFITIGAFYIGRLII
jgi:hypothetical protein